MTVIKNDVSNYVQLKVIGIPPFYGLSIAE